MPVVNQTSLIALDPDAATDSLRLACVLSPLLGIGLLARAQVRILRRSDERERADALSAMAIGFAVVMTELAVCQRRRRRTRRDAGPARTAAATFANRAGRRPEPARWRQGRHPVMVTAGGDVMSVRPAVLIFDVNETLSDLSVMDDRFSAAGAPPHLAALWFASVLRDGFALTAAGANEPFSRLARDNLREMLASVPGTPSSLTGDALDDSVEQIVAGFGELPLHPDVVEGVGALAAAGLRLVTLSNGAATVADSLLTRAGVRDRFERLLSVQDAPRWKPAREAYAYALGACGVAPDEAMLVAVHPWDIDGASRAGLRTAWVDRTGRDYPSAFWPPDLTAASIEHLAVRLKG